MKTEDKLNGWERSANAALMQGDVHEQGYAEIILDLISLVRKQKVVIHNKHFLLLEMDTLLHEALDITVDNVGEE